MSECPACWMNPTDHKYEDCPEYGEGENPMSALRNWLHDKAHRLFRDPKFLCRLYVDE